MNLTSWGSRQSASPKKLSPKYTEPKNTTAPKPVASPQNPSTVGSGRHLTDLTTIARFGDLQQHWFADHLKLITDGQKIEFSKGVR